MSSPGDHPIEPAQKPPEDRNQAHHVVTWSSGGRGGGSVPPDFGWNTNPKQWQEEHGAAMPVAPRMGQPSR